MRRSMFVVGALLVLASACGDSTAPPTVWTAPSAGRYQLTQAGTLDAEIRALIVAIFPNGLETAAASRWRGITEKVASNDLPNAQSKLTNLAQWILERGPQMDPPPNNESVSAASARLVLYMSLYVYNGPNTPVPANFGAGADAAVEVVTPGAPALLQTPLEHAAANFDAGSVNVPTIVIVTQNTNFFQQKCSGPFTTKYCQYPLFYHFQSFPQQKFQKLVHMAVCHVHTGNNYGPLPGVDHNGLVLAHDKPANASDYTPGGFPVPGENIEILPRNLTSDPTQPIVSCAGTTYPQVALFAVQRAPEGVFAKALALAARTGNGVARLAARAMTPRAAYAIDNGEEHNTFLWSDFENVDTLGHPDIKVSGSALSAPSVLAGSAVTLTYTVGNGGTAPSPVVNTVIRLTPTGTTPGVPIDLVPSPALSWNGPLFPEETHVASAVVTIPGAIAGGTYTLGAVASTAGGVAEAAGTLGDNSQPLALAVQGLQPDLVTTVSASRAFAGAGEDVVVTYSVSNVGTAASPATTAKIVLDSTAGLSQPALLDSSANIPAIPAGGSTGPLSITLRIPSVPRRIDDIRVIADRTNAANESDEANNSSSVPLTIGYPGVDGIFSPGEWGDVAGVSCTAMEVRQPEGGGLIGQLCYKNDASNLYIALRFPRTSDVSAASLGIDFDKDGSGTLSSGDDAIVANRSVFSLFDDVRVAAGAPQDVSLTGGQTNGAHAWGFSGTHMVVETVHPLNSGDPHDIAITPGASIRIRVNVRLFTPLTDTNFPNAGYFQITTTVSPP